MRVLDVRTSTGDARRAGLHASAGSRAAASAAARCVRWLALLALCAAYIQGGIDKAIGFEGAVAEMHHFGLAPAAPLAFATIVLELVAPAMILTGVQRWLGALALAVFTFGATFIANPFWAIHGAARIATENAFFEHVGLIGGFVLVAWHDLAQLSGRKRQSP